VLIWRLLVELKQGRAFPQWVEQAASRVGGILLFLLAAYVTSAPACGWLSVAVVIGLTAQFLLAAWRVDPVISFPIVWFLLKEAREAWIGREHQNGAKAKIE
jgi:hypothetical protein